MQCLRVCYTLVDSCDSNKRRYCWDHTVHTDKREKAKVMSAKRTMYGKPLSVMIQFHTENREKVRVMSAKMYGKPPSLMIQLMPHRKGRK